MTKKELTERFWREIGINCPEWLDSPDLNWISEPDDMRAAAKAIEERKIQHFCSARGIVLDG